MWPYKKREVWSNFALDIYWHLAKIRDSMETFQFNHFIIHASNEDVEDAAVVIVNHHQY